MDTQSRVNQIIRLLVQEHIIPITMDASISEYKSLQDVGIHDSLDLIELIMVIEEHYGCEVDDDDAAKWVTIGDVAEYANEKGLKLFERSDFV